MRFLYFLKLPDRFASGCSRLSSGLDDVFSLLGFIEFRALGCCGIWVEASGFGGLSVLWGSGFRIFSG